MISIIGNLSNLLENFYAHYGIDPKQIIVSQEPISGQSVYTIRISFPLPEFDINKLKEEARLFCTKFEESPFVTQLKNTYESKIIELQKKVDALNKEINNLQQYKNYVEIEKMIRSK